MVNSEYQIQCIIMTKWKRKNIKSVLLILLYFGLGSKWIHRRGFVLKSMLE
jgi:hypothetical protein